MIEDKLFKNCIISEMLPGFYTKERYVFINKLKSFIGVILYHIELQKFVKTKGNTGYFFLFLF